MNNVNLGRFWISGLQHPLYVSAVYLKAKDNVLSVLNLEPKGNEGPLRGVTSRTWGMNPDPDA